MKKLENEKPYCVITFYDSKKCNFLFNTGVSRLIDEIRKRKRSGVFALYNRYMNGVDNADAHINLYLNKHKKRKWKRALWSFLMKMGVSHAHKVKNEWLHSQGRKLIKQCVFLHELIKELVDFRDMPHIQLGNHLLIRMTNKKWVGKCSFCQQHKKVHSNSMYFCYGCKKHLHPKCWHEHHTKQRVSVGCEYQGSSICKQ